ncbi:Uma2 family endonuclease [Leptothermofonsia sp. ETS-13]|uniref:Uma2 family endonuclease n=1 Tax=Leptothermofonsia sp. ETS-13 TaxID=3035696 RepID=UPI003B9E3233
MRLNYVVWQEGVNPFVVVELLSPGTEDEDLGRTTRDSNSPPTKWEVYEQILRVPYYVLFDRYTDQLRAFGLVNARYQELDTSKQRVWMEEVKLGLGLWYGTFQGIERLWLRWYDAEGNWILTDTEQLAQVEARAEKLAQKLKELRIDPDQVG